VTEASIRYLFSSHSDHYLSIVDANYNMAFTCLKLLSSDCFDTGLSDEVIRTYMLSGVYVLQSYAVGQWLEHVRNATTQAAYLQSFPKLCDVINKFIHKRTNMDFIESGKATAASRTDFQSFKQDWPFVYEKLMEVDGFMRKRRRGLCLQGGEIKRTISTIVYPF
jgi:hypothetical protein